jgi:hypothetical protein
MTTIVTTRYNNDTWLANYENRIKRKKSCIYCSPFELSPKICYNTPVFVIEMNNSTNKIEGIGLIKNKYETTYYKIHTDGNYNRYIYIGNFHINRDIIENYNPILVYVLEKILFKGYTHSKRGSGMTCIPEKVLHLDICEGIDVKKEIKELFIYTFREKINENSIEKIA